MRFSIDFDSAAFTRQAKAYVQKTVTPALGEAVLYMAASARKQLSEATEVYFDRPIDWTVDAFAFERVEGSKAAEALVYVLPGRAEYLGLEVSGGQRVAGDFATTDQGPLVPGRDAVLDEHGNLPNGYVSDAISRGVKWIESKPGRPPILVLPGRDRLQVLAVITEKTTYKARFPFIAIVEKAVMEKAPAAVAKYLK
ncbi:hypothetical protein [Methylobacterium sp. Leaf117]|uniref:hypothetical protein n=1 Tax=Methylobacterium sp. Leaf117 TaxID=1736260 RepID=UPI0006F86573|nr:hypothetical protein [Methylobacterium sp. Leaf117]KQP91665.1 hypothetical protein ASF57_03825 [Methylobacterium sp. Leaf117]